MRRSTSDREVIKKLPDGVVSYHNYDAAGQVGSILHVASSGLLQSLYYTYDDDARRTKIVREDETSIYYNYDEASRLSEEDWLDANDAGLYAFDYQFDAAGNRTQLTKDGVTTYYEYNTLNQLTFTKTTNDELTCYTYQEDGALDRKHDGEGWVYYQWGVDEALTEIKAPSGELTGAYDAEMKRAWRAQDTTPTHFVFDGEKIAWRDEAGGARWMSAYSSEASPQADERASRSRVEPRRHGEPFDALRAGGNDTDLQNRLTRGVTRTCFNRSESQPHRSRRAHRVVATGLPGPRRVGHRSVWLHHQTQTTAPATAPPMQASARTACPGRRP